MSDKLENIVIDLNHLHLPTEGMVGFSLSIF
jgi:hypothetical protein